MFPLPSKLEWKAYLVKCWSWLICMWIKIGDKRMKRWWKLEYKPYGLQGVIHLVLVNTIPGLGFFLRMSKQSRFPKAAGKGCVCFVLSCSFFKEWNCFTLYISLTSSSFWVAASHGVMHLYLGMYTNTQDRQYEQDFFFFNCDKIYRRLTILITLKCIIQRHLLHQCCVAVTTISRNFSSSQTWVLYTFNSNWPAPPPGYTRVF